MTETRLTRIATGFHLLAIASLVLYPIVLAIGLFSPTPFGDFVAPYTELARSDWSANIWLGAIVGMIPFGFAILALNAMRQLFALYKLGDPLAPQAGPLIRKIGANLLVASILGVAILPVKSALMSMSNPVGERFVSVSLSNGDIGFILVAGLLLLIGWSMTEATKLVEENKGFV